MGNPVPVSSATASTREGGGGKASRAVRSGRCVGDNRKPDANSTGQLGNQREPSATEDSGESLGRGKPMGARAPDVAIRTGWNSGTERTPRGRGKRWLRSPWTNDAEGRAPGDRRTAVSAKSFEGQGRLGGGSDVGDSRRSARNQANPMTGSRVQQTCKPCAEQTAEVGKNDKGGTRSGVANPNLGQPSVDAHGDVGGGAIFEEPQERSLREFVISVTGRRGRQANRCVFEREATGTRCV